MWTLAKHLAGRGHLRVAAFVRSDSPDNAGVGWPQRVDNVQLVVHVDRFRRLRQQVSESIELPRFRLKRWDAHLLWRLPALLATRPFRRRDALPCHPDPRLIDRDVDYWITFGNSSDSSNVIATAKANGTPCAVSIQSNDGVDGRLAGPGEFINPSGEPASSRRYVLAEADQVMCQTEWQANRLATRFGRQGIVIRNPIDTSAWSPSRTSPMTPGTRPVLWIGRFDDFHKRPLMMLDLVTQCPDIQFDMIINPLDSEIEREFRARCPDNVRVISSVPFADMPGVFREVAMFVSTGNPDFEGFPNVLLQAAACHTPSVSLHDYDQFLDRSGAGIACGGSMDRLALAVRQVWERPQFNWDRVDRYLAEHHDADRIAAKVEAMVFEACK